jgi:dihydroflavonol-4-reductase
MTAKPTVLVTGASGFIAKHIVRELLDAGYPVRASVRSPGRGDEVRKAVGPAVRSAGDLDARLSFVTLDLERDEGWDTALQGVGALVHTASPFPLAQPRDEQVVIRPAVEGTRRALRAARAAGVGRVVLTSSIVAIMNADPPPGRDGLDERDWSKLEGPGATPYLKSKTLAERTAWEIADREGLHLTTINPGLVLGPPLDGRIGTSLEVVQRLLKGRDPMLPNFGFPVVDVRDVALMHVRALERPEAVGSRFLAGDEFVWFPALALWLKAAFPERRIPTRRAPNWLIRVIGLFDGQVGSIVPNLDRIVKVSAARARAVLGVEFVPARESAVAAARELIRLGLA